MKTVRYIFFSIVCLCFTFESTYAAMQAHERPPLNVEHYTRLQKKLDSMDQKSIENARELRAQIISDLESLSAQQLRAFYNALPNEAHTFKYACLLQCAYKFNVDLDQKIKAALFFRNLHSLINFEEDAQTAAHNGFYTPLFDQEHVGDVLPLLEHVTHEQIIRLNLTKSDIKAFPMTMLQLRKLNTIVCKDDIKKWYGFKEKWNIIFYQHGTSKL
jgi:hypothetical protein